MPLDSRAAQIYGSQAAPSIGKENHLTTWREAIRDQRLPFENFMTPQSFSTSATMSTAKEITPILCPNL